MCLQFERSKRLFRFNHNELNVDIVFWYHESRHNMQLKKYYMTQGQKISKNDDRSNKTDVMFDYWCVWALHKLWYDYSFWQKSPPTQCAELRLNIFMHTIPQLYINECITAFNNELIIPCWDQLTGMILNWPSNVIAINHDSVSNQPPSFQICLYLPQNPQKTIWALYFVSEFSTLSEFCPYNILNSD